MLQSAGQTTNFTIQYEDTLPNSAKRAAALLAACENEFTILMNWFGLTSGFGTGNRVTVNLNQPDSFSADNFGYATGGASLIRMNAQSSNASDATAAEIVKMAFVAEFVEILMDLRNSTTGSATWNRLYSHGEGLSLLCAILRYPTGFAAFYSSPWVNTWLQSAARTDWITAPQLTDKVADSFGCSLLFLFYLKDQLSHSVPDIIQKGGANLESTYKNLTGNTSAYTNFTTFLQPYFPLGATPALATNDPFPLLETGGRDILLNFSQQSTGKPSIINSGEANVSPGFFCPKKIYPFEIIHTPRQLVCEATGHGFGFPVFSWRVNGADISGSYGSISPSTSVFVDDPSQPGLGSGTVIPEVMNFTVTTTDFKSTLVLEFPELVGHPRLYFEIFAKEKFFPGDTNSEVTTAHKVDNAFLVFGTQYYVDRDACEKAFEAILHKYLRYDWQFNIIHTLPDPPWELLQAIQQVKEFNIAMKELEQKSPETAGRVLAVVTQALGIDREALRAIGTAGVYVRTDEKRNEK
jgi:hypothetical protein